MSGRFESVVEEYRDKIESGKFNWNEFTKGRSLEEAVSENLASFYILARSNGYTEDILENRFKTKEEIQRFRKWIEQERISRNNEDQLFN